MGSKLISNQANRANNSPRANRDHGSRPLLARRQGQFCLQSGQQPAQPCCIWEHDPTTALGKRRVQIALDAQALFCRRRHQARRPPQAKTRPGSPAPTMGPHLFPPVQRELRRVHWSKEASSLGFASPDWVTLNVLCYRIMSSPRLQIAWTNERSSPDRGRPIHFTTVARSDRSDTSGHQTRRVSRSPRRRARSVFRQLRPIGYVTALPPARWRRGRSSRIGQLQRLQRIDEARAEIVVALAR
jgi:hypothetical protein